MKDQIYDVAIVGGGPGGIAAAIWCKRVALKCVIVEKASALGGQLSMIHTSIPDFPGLICTSGAELRMHLENHLDQLEIPYFLNMGAERIEQSADGFVISSAQEKLVARTVIIATGVARRRFALADSFVGTGVSYTASGAIAIFQGRTCAILGGGDGALENAVRLSKICPMVHVIARGTALRAREHFIEEVQAQSNIIVHYQTVVEELIGADALESIVIRKNGQRITLDVETFLVKIGFAPVVHVGGLTLACTSGGHIDTSATQKTSISGVWAIGDVCEALDPSLSVAMGQACVAARDIARYFRGET